MRKSINLYSSNISYFVQRRGQYLELCRRVVRHSNYNEHHHRKEDILKCLQLILTEELDESKSDQTLVNNIMEEFPETFGGK